MKHIPLLILFSVIANTPPTLCMERTKEKEKVSTAQYRVYDIKNSHLTISQEELNQIDTETIQVQDGNTLKSLNDLKMLSLHNNQLTSVPTQICSLTNLQILLLGYNQLTSVPIQIYSLTNLQILLLGYNQLTSVPTQIGSLTNLKVLLLHDNQLTSIPTQIGSLTNLKELGLCNNQLTSVPAQIGSLTNLLELGLNNNKLTSIPTEIGSLTKLQILWLCNNNLESLPPALAQLNQLKMLNIMNNDFGKGVVEPASIAYIIFNLAGKKVLRAAKSVIKEKSTPLKYGFDELTKNDLTITKEINLFTLLAIISQYLPLVKRYIVEQTNTNKPNKVLEHLTTLRDYTELYQWLTSLSMQNKVLLGNPIDTKYWGENENHNTGCRDIRKKLFTLMNELIK